MPARKKNKSTNRRGIELVYYLGYAYNPASSGELSVRRPTKHCNYDMPSAFKWHSGSDLSTLHLYIEALHNHDQLTIDQFNERMLAYDQQYLDPPSPNEPPPTITIGKQRLLNLLQGSERLTCRADATLCLSTAESGDSDPRKFCVRAFAAFMAAEGYFDADEYAGLINSEGRTISYNGYRSEMRKKYGVEPGDFHTGINIKDELRHPQTLHADLGPEVHVSPVEPEPVEETPITDKDKGSYREVLTLAKQGSLKYYIKRLIHKGIEIYAATAYDLKGSWTVYHRDAARLLALGIKE